MQSPLMPRGIANSIIEGVRSAGSDPPGGARRRQGAAGRHVAGKRRGNSHMYPHACRPIVLTGALPFEADSLASLAHMIAYADRPSARAANPALPETVDELLSRGLAQLPNDRYASCTSLSRNWKGQSRRFHQRCRYPGWLENGGRGLRSATGRAPAALPLP